MSRDERYAADRGVDRRTFVKAALGVGAGGVAGSPVGSGGAPLPPPGQPAGEVNEGFVYAKADIPNPYGFDWYAGEEARVEHFTKPWAGVATLWRALFDDEGAQVPGTGFPVLLIRVDAELLIRPAEWTTDAYIADEGIVAASERTGSPPRAP